ncbi:protease modulator HflC [Thiohalorhabdus methylotrophus]|uniref:Protein HflC n=1 Tax=Thiohalorhabdus methylotrophus TaxID=3242694 RepID=A0ABV4U1K4_9GAMM
MNRIAGIAIAVVLVLGAIIAAFSLFTVDETESALVLQFGEPRASVTEPGLHVKRPFVQNVKYFNAQVLDFDDQARTYVTSDKKNLIIDAYSKWRIVEPLRFYITVQNTMSARSRLGDLIRSNLREEIGKRNLQQTVSGERRQVMENLTQAVSKQAETMGIEVLDVRIKRTDLPQENEQAVYDRMAAEREREAREYRAEGAEQAEEIMATADRKRSEILAQARRKAEEVKGQADAKATKIYNSAYSLDSEFFALYRSLQGYQRAFTGDELMVLSPESEFFKFFKRSETKPKQ